MESIKRRLVQATKQSEHIIFDLRRINAKNETKILRVLEKGLIKTGKDEPLRDDLIPILKEACLMGADALENKNIFKKIIDRFFKK